MTFPLSKYTDQAELFSPVWSESLQPTGKIFDPEQKLFLSAERILRTDWAHFRVDLNHFIKVFLRLYIGSLDCVCSGSFIVLTLCMLVYFQDSLYSTEYFAKLTLSKQYFHNVTSVSNRLYPDQGRRSVTLDLGPNWLQTISVDNNSRHKVNKLSNHEEIVLWKGIERRFNVCFSYCVYSI